MNAMGERRTCYGMDGEKKREIATGTIAVFSVCAYIICSVVFEFTAVSSVNLASLSLFACLGICALDCFLRREIRFDWSFALMLVFGVIVLISTFYTPASKAVTVSRLYRYWTSVVVAFLASNVIASVKDVKRIIAAFMLSGVLLAVYIYAFYGFDALAFSGTRMQNGDFGNVNTVGLYCAFSAFLGIYAMVALKWNKVLCILVSLICLPCVMFTGSRKALLSLIVCLTAFTFAYSSNKGLLKKILICLLVIVAFVIALNVVPAFAPIKERMLGLFDLLGGDAASVAGDASRLRYISAGIKGFLESPFYGKGFCYSYYLLGTYTHNNYVELLMCHGIIGFAAYYALYILLARDAFRIRENKAIFSFVIVVLIRLLFEHIGVVDYYTRMTLLTLAILSRSTQLALEDTL